jgi:hypothetical protein
MFGVHQGNLGLVWDGDGEMGVGGGKVDGMALKRARQHLTQPD